MISNGFHCSDLGTASGLADPTIEAVQTAALLAMKNWLAEWKPSGSLGYSKTVPGGSVTVVTQENTSSPKPLNAFYKSTGTF